jgi:hypothetical protein
MAKPKQYRVVDPVGVVGFNGVIHKTGDVIAAADAPQANLKAWLRFGQVEEVKPDDAEAAAPAPAVGPGGDSGSTAAPAEKKEKGSRK